MSQEQLAKAAGVGLMTIAMFELGKRIPHDRTLEKLKDALERRGIVFTNGDKPSVTLDRSKATIPV
jgi:transcriptional regulator with XRE-family HTH domain